MIRIEGLPDDVLLETFDFYLMFPEKKRVEAWQSLVHVCRQWRNLIFQSPRRLNLQLVCTPKTPTFDRLDVWPALPLLVRGSMAFSSTKNVIAALGKTNRVREVTLSGFAGWQLEEVLAAMEVPFPELTALELVSDSETPPVISDSFLGGSAPYLRILQLDAIPFPGLPKLLLSANHLLALHLDHIPHSGYISPEAMVAPLSVLSSLESLSLEFQSPQSRPNWESQSLPPPKRSILPALATFRFKGATEYLEELLARIDTPQLHKMVITFFNQINFDCPRLAQFIDCTPKFRPLNEAHLRFDYGTANIKLISWKSNFPFGDLRIHILCREPDWQVSSIEQVFNSLHPLSKVEGLYIERQYSETVWKSDAIENTLWLELLLPFTAVKNLYLSKEFASDVAAALQELIGRRITEVLPSLQNIFVEGLEPSGPFQDNIRQFADARRLSDHPIAISVWKMNSM